LRQSLRKIIPLRNRRAFNHGLKRASGACIHHLLYATWQGSVNQLTLLREREALQERGSVARDVDIQRVAQGDLPKPRSAFSQGAPLAPSRKGGSSGSFPGGRGATYYSSSEPK
jgi:hypothetical protein